MLAIIAAALLCAPYEAEFVGLFTPLEHQFKGQSYRYRLFTPTTDEPKPLLVWLHGMGEAGDNNFQQLRWLQLVFRPPWERSRFPFFLLALQTPKDNAAWIRDEPGKDDMIDVLVGVVEDLLSQYPIDQERIYLSGVSSGGSGCWELALRRPELFAAVAPIASSGTSGDLTRCKNIPFWVFHCDDDEITPFQLPQRSVEVLRSCGGTVHLTTVHSGLHDAWTPAFEDYHLLDWLLAQRRGQTGAPPGTITFSTRIADLSKSWNSWQVVLQILIPVTMTVMLWQAIRRVRSRHEGRNTHSGHRA